MRTQTRIGFYFILFSTIILPSTLIRGPVQQVEVPFTTPSGLSGKIVLFVPLRVYAGDKSVLRAHIDFNEGLEGLEKVQVVGRLEIGVEELYPRGETTISLKPAIPVEIVWQMRTARKAIYPGNLWISASSGSTRDLLLVKEIQIDSRLLLGTPAYNIRIGAGFIAAFGLIMLLLSIFRPRTE